MSRPLSPAQFRLLRLIEREPVEIQDAARRLKTTVAGISNTRSMLRGYGMIEPWSLWQGPIVISAAGRKALASEDKPLEDADARRRLR